KMVRRHPHVFGPVRVSGSAEVSRNWDRIKAAEAKEGGAHSPAASLERLPEALPALLRAQRVGEKAAKAHLDFGCLGDALAEARAAGPPSWYDHRRGHPLR